MKKLYFASGLTGCFLVVASCSKSSPPATMVPDSTQVSTLSESVEDTSTPKSGTSGIDLAQMDQSIPPGQDFFAHSNGTWLQSYELPDDKVGYGVFGELREAAESRVRTIVEELASEKHEPGSTEQRIGDLFRSYMDRETRDELGIKPIGKDLKKIAKIKNKKDLIKMFGKADLTGTAAGAGVGYTVDAKKPTHHVLAVHVGWFNLPDRDYYLEDNFKSEQKAYRAHIAQMLGFLGYSPKRAKKSAKKIYEMEKMSAKNSLSRTESRDPVKTYNIVSYKDLKSKYKGMDWDRLFAASGIEGKVKKVQVFSKKMLKANIDIVNKTPLETWKDILNYTLISNQAGVLSAEIEQANFEFWGKRLRGQQSPEEMWKRGIAFVAGVFGEGIGKVYVERHFSESSKKQMLALVDNLRGALKSRINKLSWMTDETKKKGIKKLSEVDSSKIGYPDKWENYEGLKVVADDLMANVRSSRAYMRKKSLDEGRKPVDKTRWGMSPQVVNAYYNPVNNEVVFPAAILQPPFFDPDADPAVNYGAIGVVIGHELSHGFDDQGRMYDGDGVLRDWWGKADSEEFMERAKVLSERFSKFEALPGLFVDGDFTLGENIGDLGGVMIAYAAYRRSLNGKEAPVLDGYTGDQRFFLSYGQIWRGVDRPEALKQKLRSDPHSPYEYRVNGILPHVDAWYKAFEIEEGDPMYIAPDDRIRIW